MANTKSVVCIGFALSLHFLHLASSNGECYTATTESYGKTRVQNTDFQYHWPQLSTGTTEFTVFVKGDNDAYITLSPRNSGIADDEADDPGIPKIVIGGWNNEDSGFICNSIGDWRRFDTPSILNSTEAKEFFVKFDNDHLQVGEVGQEPFMMWNYTCHVDVKYIGIAKGHSHMTAEWRYCPTGIPTTNAGFTSTSENSMLTSPLLSTFSTLSETKTSNASIAASTDFKHTHITVQTLFSSETVVDNGLPVAMIAGPLGGVSVVILLMIPMAIWFLKRRKRSDIDQTRGGHMGESDQKAVTLSNVVYEIGEINTNYQNTGQQNEGITVIPKYAFVDVDKADTIPEYIDIYEDYPNATPGYSGVVNKNDHNYADVAPKYNTYKDAPTYAVMNKEEEEGGNGETEGWMDNSLYATSVDGKQGNEQTGGRTGKKEGGVGNMEGWMDNSIYATSGDGDGDGKNEQKEGWEENAIYATGN